MTSDPNGSNGHDSSRIAVPADEYDAFHAAPVSGVSSDPRFRVRRIPEQEFERVYDCVDAAFDSRRPRDVYDWLYRRNPYGRARVWAVEELATGRMLKTGASFPWPVWDGQRPLRGALSGDAATVPDWQRRGLAKIRREVRHTHPWHGTVVAISGPNEGSRIVTAKQGKSDDILGRLKGGALPLCLPVGGSRPGAFSAALLRGLHGLLLLCGRYE